MGLRYNHLSFQDLGPSGEDLCITPWTHWMRAVEGYISLHCESGAFTMNLYDCFGRVMCQAYTNLGVLI